MQRRGSNFYRTHLQNMIKLFEPGDVVYFNLAPHDVFGIVSKVSSKENKVYVAWNGGDIKQHDPDEVGLALWVSDSTRKNIEDKLKNGISDGEMHVLGQRRATKSKNVEQPYEQFSGDPKEHGIEDPISGGTNVMQKLVKKLRKESINDSGLIESSTGTMDGFKCRRAMYHKERGRVYKQTKSEAEQGIITCPRCKNPGMNQEPFTKSIKIYICPHCGWKITTDKMI